MKRGGLFGKGLQGLHVQRPDSGQETGLFGPVTVDDVGTASSPGRTVFIVGGQSQMLARLRQRHARASLLVCWVNATGGIDKWEKGLVSHKAQVNNKCCTFRRVSTALRRSDNGGFCGA